jgi:hypothetical protein
MGADFMYAVAPIWKATDERKAKLKQVIADISDEAIQDYENTWYVFNTEDNNEARKMIFDACMACEESNFQTRETGDMKLAEMNWRAVITGGMSWGDNPTDAFGSISMVGTIEEVYSLLKQWSIEDNKPMSS